jgi:hypothetical protein
MGDPPANASRGPNKILSGPEIVDHFIRAIEADPSLDKATINAIKLLHAEGKLSWTSLLRSLEQARGIAKI